MSLLQVRNVPDEARMRDDELHAPTLLDVEVVSALRGLTLGGELECPLLTRDSRLARSSGHDVRIEVQ